MLYAVITTIQEPTTSVVALADKLEKVGGTLIVAGDKKGPAAFGNPGEGPWPVRFMSLADQEASGFKLAENLPTGHYTRKNLGYLAAIQSGATCIYETDDDNAPNAFWRVREEAVPDCRMVTPGDSRWVNVYRFFSEENIWPRGLPLDEIDKPLPSLQAGSETRRSPIQQGLVNGSPDVDAIWRLCMDRPFTFANSPAVYLGAGNWCPFNTQSTWWWPLAFPLLYIPSHCSFRMCDIWKSFVAQRCLWELDLGITFHAPEVDQERNYHDLMRDFSDEIPGYVGNRDLCDALGSLRLEKGESAVAANLLRCYEELVRKGYFPEAELPLVGSWIEDIGRLTR